MGVVTLTEDAPGGQRTRKVKPSPVDLKKSRVLQFV